jgi:ABC-type nitrate/sulfonate/bicarbonate transport system substrate-binding protein
MRPANGSVVVAGWSAIRTIADLKGRRVALLDGSFHTYLLARALERARLRLPDVERVELSPAASQRALAAGEVDAWVAMAPLLGSAMQAGNIRVIAANEGLIPNRSIFWTIEERGLNEAVLAQATADLVRFGAAVAADPDQAAALLADARASDADLEAWRAAVAARDWKIWPASPEILAEQAMEADTLRRHGVLGPALVPA